jgi:outer membrane protein assembly factor BamB
MLYKPFVATTFCVVAVSTLTLTAREPKPEDTWPGFRGHEMSGVAATARIPDTWSTSEHVKWAVPIAGHGWSSPIVWGDTVFVTSAISSQPFKKPTPGLYGNEYIAEMAAQGLSDEEISKRAQARDNELTAEASEIRYMVYALDGKTGKIKWEREAIRTKPFGGRHRKNTYASETPVTDGERLYASFGQNVGLFVYSLDGRLLWKKQWEPKAIYLDFGTGSSPTVSDGRVYLLQDNEEQPAIAALDAKTGREIWRTPRSGTGFPLKSSWMTPFVWKNSLRTEIVTTGHGAVISYDLQGKELWRATRMSMPTASPFAAGGFLYVGTGSQETRSAVPGHQAGAAGDISLKPGRRPVHRMVGFAAWATPSALVHEGRVLVHDTGILTCSTRRRGSNLWSASAAAAGRFPRHRSASSACNTDEEGVTLCRVGPRVRAREKRSRRNVAASPAIAGDAIYIRTETKL